ncbi:Amidinotransferase family protein, partial [Ophiobolus disseminans]
LVDAGNERSQLRSVIVGRTTHPCFPHEPPHMIKATMPALHQKLFQPDSPFPEHILQKEDAELDQLARVLQEEGVIMYRPNVVDWRKIGGYTAAMIRDELTTVGNTIIEAPYAWGCRKHEIDLAYGEFLNQMAGAGFTAIIRAPSISDLDTIYDGIRESEHGADHIWAINNSRPAFDCADFMRFGKVLIGQYSNVTNQKGIEYLRASVPDGYTVEILEVDDSHAMHIDATILPLKQGLLVYNPLRTSEEALRKHAVLRGWDLHAYPFVPKKRDDPPLFMTSGWLCMNVLSLSDKKVVLEEHDVEFADWVWQFGIEPILLPFQNVNSIGGSFHCATVDLLRDSKWGTDVAPQDGCR